MQGAICKYNKHRGGPIMSELVDIHAELGRPRSSTTNDLSDHAAVDISVVMPCLNEEGSVGLCVSKAWEGIRRTGLRGEVIVADNGSTDNSRAVAEAAGARVVHQPRRGYGNAYMKGFGAARGRIIVMGDSDDSYDFTSLPDVVRPLDHGADYVLGSRFAGQIRKGAMTWSHRYGNPVLTTILNVLFKLKVSDAHSGFRAFTRRALDKMALQCEGMEFASEIVVKAARADLRVAEVPITYHCRIGQSKLNSFKDGWRHLRFLLLLSPDYLFVMPGIACLGIGFLSQLVLLGAGGSSSALAGKIMLALVTLAGSQLLTFGLFAKTYAKSIGLDKKSRVSEWVERAFTLEHGLVCGAGLCMAGLAVVIHQSVEGWGPVAAGGLSASTTILGLLSTVLGASVWFDAFFLTMFHLKRPSPAVTLPSSEFGTEPREAPASIAVSGGAAN
jgi:glycosyltransferase involved in cell wall biosynthesis